MDFVIILRTYIVSYLGWIFSAQFNPVCRDKIFNPVKPQGWINLIDHKLDFLWSQPEPVNQKWKKKKKK